MPSDDVIARTTAELARAIHAVGVSGSPVCVHASLRSFGAEPLEPGVVVEAFLDAGCTVIVPTFTAWFSAPAPNNRRIPRNGMDYDAPVHDWWTQDPGYRPEYATASYDASTAECESGMGAVPKYVAARSDRFRGAHPTESFSAVGNDAAEMVPAQSLLDVYSPLSQLAERGGHVVLIGVGLTRMTLIHEAERRSGQELFRRWARLGGSVVEVNSGKCSDGFESLAPALRSVERQVRVGASQWRVFPAAAAVDAAAAALRARRGLTICSPTCLECQDAAAGGPILN